MKLAVVILNFNGAKHLETFLPSVVKYSEAPIWVADNGSADNSKKVVEGFAQVNWLALDQNYGYAGGYNEALKKIDAEIYILLNSDVEVTEHWLNPMRKTFEEKPEVVAIQPKILSYTQKGSFEYAGASGGLLDLWGVPFCRGRIFNRCEKDEGQYNEEAEIFWASGACLAIRSAAFWEAGGFDPSFFAHMEEIDLCWRLHSLGKSIYAKPESVVYHLGGGTLHKSNPRKTYLNYRNGLIMLLKNLPKKVLIRRIFVRLILDGFSGVSFLFKGQWRDTLAIIKAHFHFYALAPKVYKASKNAPRSDKALAPFSIVWQFYLLNRKTYTALPHD
ncbi:glycosyltransferase family 2 protein [Marinilongibacter aquaticus]|uniref:glycosyltransferase family 2 protein n=1 Tax=Marinilongibacter aquaticus TaxID=2975157 RepID=UPI00286E48B1|nr:glycosyltransferase family 2 protein [Marinilongibacter aquaticus]